MAFDAKVSLKPLMISDIAYNNLQESDIAEIRSHINSPKTLMVHYETPALDLARKVDARGVELVVVCDQESRITGVVHAPWAANQIATNLRVDIGGFEEALTKLMEISGPPYRHEWLTGAQPPLVWCHAHGHWASSDPCRR